MDMIKHKSSLLKSSASLATVTAKQYFLQVCSNHGFLPNGFILKFSQQTGLPEDLAVQSKHMVDSVLREASSKLLEVTREAENLKSDLLYRKILETICALDPDERNSLVNLAVAKYKKILLLKTKIHGKKIRKLGYLQPIIMDLDNVVSSFETKISDNSGNTSVPSVQPVFDWFDPDDFPPLEVSVRRDWTVDIPDVDTPQLVELDPLAASTPGPVVVPLATSQDIFVSFTPESSEIEGYPRTSSAASPGRAEIEGYPRTSSDTVGDVPQQAPSVPFISPYLEKKVSESPIIVVDYPSSNFKPLILHDIEVSEGVVSLLKKGPTFTPTPLDPPDIAALQEDVWDWKERVRWAYCFRRQKLLENPETNLDAEPFVKPPWYRRTEKSAPKASEEVETFLSSVEAFLLSSSSYSNFVSNVTLAESRAFTDLREMKKEGISVFLQDKSSRFVVAKSDIIAAKVDNDMNDHLRYQKMDEDDTIQILKKIQAWYKKRKKNLTVVDDDISEWLINNDSKPGKVKVLVKTHKPDMPVREVFSVCSQPVENLSSFLQFSYLGPIVNSGVLKWRLKDTNEFIKFLHTVNDYLVENKVTSMPSICSIDIKNMFPSIFKDLALPAIKSRLMQRGHGRAEVNAVLEALEIVRDGTRVKWRNDLIKQIDGCSLGPADSCDYSDIALDSFLQVVVPIIEASLGLDLSFLRFFRDDGFLFFIGEGSIILDMLDILNSQRDELTFTTEYCACGNVLGCCHLCDKKIPFLDCLVSVYTIETDDGCIIPQLKSITYSKPTDVHHYIEPSSCTPNLHHKSLGIIKGVAHRLRVTNMLDQDLLLALNNFSGYLVASGYDKVTVIKHFTDIMACSNKSLVFREKEVDTTFKIALVTDMHPALPKVQKLFDRFYPVIKSSSFSSKIFPRESLICTSRKLRNLSMILASNPFQIPLQPSQPKGFHPTFGCKCKICKEGVFSTVVYPQVSKERGFSLPAPINCRSVNVIYLIICPCEKYYVGRTEDPRARWRNHKSHVRTAYTSCNLATHCVNNHKELVGADTLYDLGEVRSAFKFTLLESLGENADLNELKKKEDTWRTRLESWVPIGLNVRED